MTTIDHRVVEMNFDNKQFESGVDTTLKSLGNLKKGLNLEDSVKSINNLSNAGKSFSLQSISDGVSQLTSRFSALGIIGLTVFQNLTNSVINLGKKIVMSISVDPLRKGLAEYETQIGAIQTILANTSSKGTTLDQVNAALDQLNEYSDKTIYNFTQMTKNIGTFTAAGIDLDTSVQAIKGIANLAAVSGSTSEQASTAMYQLSQALASGTVKLMDWNSVVNAGMGGQIFQDALKETARVHGIAIDDMIKSEGSFRETLQKGWLTSDILTETLSKFTGDLNESQLRTMGYTEEQIAGIVKLGKMANDAATKVKTFSQLKDTLAEAIQSGWSQTWRIIIGDFEEAKNLFTEVSDTLGTFISESANARNTLLQGWKDLGGRTALITAIKNTFEGLLSIIKPIKEAFAEIFPKITSQQLFAITKGIEEFSKKLKISGETADKVKRIFRGIASVLDIAFTAIKKLITALFDLVGAVAPSGDSILDFLAGIGDFLSGVRDAVNINDTFGKSIDRVKTFATDAKDGLDRLHTSITNISDKIKEVFSNAFKNVDLSGFKKFADKVEIRFEPLKALANGLAKAFEWILTITQKVAPLAAKIGEVLSEGLGKLGSSIAEGIGNLDFDKIIDALNAGILTSLILLIRKFLVEGFTGFKEISDILGNVSGILDGVRGSLEAYQTSLKAKTLLTIAFAIGVLAAACVTLAMIDSAKLASSLGAMTAMFAQLVVSMALFSQIPGTGGAAGTAAAMILFTLSILLLVSALKKLTEIDQEDLIKGIVGIEALTATVLVFAKIMSQNTGGIILGSAGLILFAVSIKILASAVEQLAKLDFDALKAGLIGVGVILAEISLFLKVTDLSGMGIQKTIGILIMAGAINMLALAVERFAALDASKMMNGLIAIGAILTEIALFINLTNGITGIIPMAVGLTIVSMALLLLAKAMSMMSGLSWEEIARGLVAMGGALVIIGAAMELMPPNMIVTSVALIIVAEALSVIAKALGNMGKMSWEEIAKGLVALGASMLILAAGMYAMEGALPGAAAMIVIAAALAVFVPAFKTLGSMSWEEIGRGLVALAGAFLVLGVAGALITPVIPTLLALSAAMLLLGVAILAVGTGIFLFSAGLAALAVSGVAGAAAIVTMIGTLLSIVPMVVKSLVNAIITFATLIAEAAPALGKALKAVLLTLIDVIVSVIPPLVDAILELVSYLLKALVSKLPEIIEAGMQIILALLKGVRDHIEEIVVVAIEIVTKFIDGIASKLPDIIESGWNLILSFINGLTDSVEANLPQLIEAIERLGIAIIEGLIKGLVGGASNVAEAVKNIGETVKAEFQEVLGINSPSVVFQEFGDSTMVGFINGFNGRVSELLALMVDTAIKLVSAGRDEINLHYEEFVKAGKNLIEGFISGIKALISRAKEAMRSVIDAVKSAVSNKVGEFYSIGASLVQGLADGISAFIYKAVAEAYSLATQVIEVIKDILGIESPSYITYSDGRFLVLGLANGIKKYTDVAVGAADDLGTNTINTIGNAISRINQFLSENIDMTPTITPVLDLSNIASESKNINSLLKNKGINVGSIASNLPVLSRNQDISQNSGDGINPVSSTTSVQFVQNNYSPKELSRLEIYRQTRNQLSILKGLVQSG